MFISTQEKGEITAQILSIHDKIERMGRALGLVWLSTPKQCRNKHGVMKGYVEWDWHKAQRDCPVHGHLARPEAVFEVEVDRGDIEDAMKQTREILSKVMSGAEKPATLPANPLADLFAGIQKDIENKPRRRGRPLGSKSKK